MIERCSKPQVCLRPTSGWAALDLREVWAYRDVLVMLALRDIKLRYKQTALGFVWVVLQPTLAAIIFAVIFGRFAGLPSDGHPYLLFVFSGLLGWNLFAGILQRGGNSLVAEARLISKVYFPRLLIPLAAAGSALVDFGVSTLVMVVLLFWFEVWPGSNLLLLPLGLLLILALGVGASLWLAALNVRYRDFGYTLPFLIQLWMFASPVVYGVALLESGFRPWFALNPMVGAIELLRAALLGDSSLGWDLVMPGAAISFLVLITGVLFFRRAERGFADVL